MARPQKRSKAMKLVNLENGMPSVPLALSLLNDALRSGRMEGFTALKIVHGYGSSGIGGALRSALQAALMRHEQAGEVRAFIAGEDWRISDERSWALLQKCPELKADVDLGRGNKGISLVVL
ncbi:MAG TPA: Smr/MutS family protein [Terriglobales bacterium]|nr:Smr/MutS family protein [Terriglobales bacterium]